MSKRLNKFVSVLVCICMLLSMQCMLSVNADADYAFKNVLIGEYSSAGTSLIIGWRNPKADTITNVTLYDITDGTETAIKSDFATTNDLTIEHEITGLETEVSKTYKVKATFSDADPVEYIVSGTPKSNAKTVKKWFHTADETNSKGFVVSYEAKYAIPPASIGIDNTVGYDSSSSSLHIAVNRPTSGNSVEVMYYYDKSKLASTTTTLQLNFQAKGADISGVSRMPVSSGQWVFAKDAKTNLNDWTKYTKTMNVNTSGWVKFAFTQTVEDLWIDNIELYEVDSDGNVGTENLITGGDFETLEAAPSAVTNATATATDDGIKLSWTDETAAYYRVYNSEGKEIAYLCGDTDEVYLSGLSTDEAHSFTVKPVSFFGTVGASTSIAYAPAVAETRYDFKNVFVGEYSQGGTIMTLGWRNPKTSTLTDVLLYDITDGTETLLKDDIDLTSDAVLEYQLTDMTGGTNKIFKLKATFSDADPVEFIVSGRTRTSTKDGGIKIWLPGADSENAKGLALTFDKNYTSVPYKATIEDGALHIAISKSVPADKNVLNLQYYFDNTTTAIQNADHLASTFKVKGANITEIDTGLVKSGGADYITDATSFADWTDQTRTFGTKNSSGNLVTWSRFVFTGAVEDFWIDDFTLCPVDSDSNTDENIVIDGGFSTAESAPSAVTDVTATTTDDGYKLSWTDTAAAGYNVYDSTGRLVASLCGETDEVYITDISNGCDFTIKPTATFGTEGAGTTVTCVPVPYKISDFTLSSGENITAGNATVSVDVTNNTVADGMSVELIVALYDGDKLVKAEFGEAPVTVAKGEKKTVTETIEVPSLDGGVYTVKAFLWKSLEGMEPYGPSKAFTE